MGYRTCEYCGANLDPEEKCDCRKEIDPSKESLLAAFAGVLRMTGRDVIDLELVDDETVRILYEGNSSRLVNIAMDSRIAIIRDVAEKVG